MWYDMLVEHEKKPQRFSHEFTGTINRIRLTNQVHVNFETIYHTVLCFSTVNLLQLKLMIERLLSRLDTPRMR